jgi:hypothetical protein
MAMSRSEKMAAKKIDKRIEAAYYRTCNGVQIDIMDISKVFRVGKAALDMGADEAGLETAIKDFVETIRHN